ncbi:MAG: hypothetical protein ACI4K5_04220 [Ruminococcus sp.]
MKKSRIISLLTALTLTAVSTVPMISSAMTVDDIPEVPARIIRNFYGEDAYIEKTDGDVYYCLGQKKMGAVKCGNPYMTVTMKGTRSLDLNEIINPYGLICTETDEYGRYVIVPSEDLTESRETLMNELYPEVAEVLSKYDDIFHIEQHCWAGQDNVIKYAEIIVKNATLNEEDFPNFVITPVDDNTVKLTHQKYFRTLSDDYTGREISVNYYYSELYETYMSLIEQYGDENLSLELPVQDYSELDESIGTRDSLYHFIEPVPETGFMNDIVSYFEGKNAYVEKTSDNKRVSVITDYSSDTYEKSEYGIYITVKKGTELLPDDIGISDYYLQKTDDTTYWLKSAWQYYDDSLLSNMKKNKKIVSIDKGYEITKLDFHVYGLSIETDMTDEEMQEKYPDIEKNNQYYCTYNGDNIYQQLKELQNDERISRVSVMKAIPDIVPPSFAPSFDDEYIENLYTAKIKGDVNADGEMDIADSVTISAYVANSELNPINVEQRIINGDVHNTGDGLTANDSLMIQQYLAGKIENL